jgi:hypothetical protein
VLAQDVGQSRGDAHRAAAGLRLRRTETDATGDLYQLTVDLDLPLQQVDVPEGQACQLAPPEADVGRSEDQGPVVGRVGLGQRHDLLGLEEPHLPGALGRERHSSDRVLRESFLRHGDAEDGPQDDGMTADGAGGKFPPGLLLGHHRSHVGRADPGQRPLTEPGEQIVPNDPHVQVPCGGSEADRRGFPPLDPLRECHPPQGWVDPPSGEL